jgi:hypothetical protein
MNHLEARSVSAVQSAHTTAVLGPSVGCVRLEHHIGELEDLDGEVDAACGDDGGDEGSGDDDHDDESHGGSNDRSDNVMMILMVMIVMGRLTRSAK